jgi:hypothetical protein
VSTFALASGIVAVTVGTRTTMKTALSVPQDVAAIDRQ